MNPQMPVETQQEKSTDASIALDETALLKGWGFTPQEITSLLWLRQWYQSGGSDRISIIRQLEFLRMLVQSGELEL
jgi:hypothetical protein